MTTVVMPMPRHDDDRCDIHSTARWWQLWCPLPISRVGRCAWEDDPDKCWWYNDDDDDSHATAAAAADDDADDDNVTFTVNVSFLEYLEHWTIVWLKKKKWTEFWNDPNHIWLREGEIEKCLQSPIRCVEKIHFYLAKKLAHQLVYAIAVLVAPVIVSIIVADALVVVVICGSVWKRNTDWYRFCHHKEHETRTRARSNITLGLETNIHQSFPTVEDSKECLCKICYLAWHEENNTKIDEVSPLQL